MHRLISSISPIRFTTNILIFFYCHSNRSFFLRIYIMLFSLIPMTLLIWSYYQTSEYQLLTSTNKLHISTPRLPPVIFLYFPQWHSIPENSRRGFSGHDMTDWDFLRRFLKEYPNERPIEEPGELGYYNLLEYDVRKRQGELLHIYCGEDCVIMYHIYWFDSRPVMDSPLQLMLKDGEPKTKFFFNWANHNWQTQYSGQGQPIRLRWNMGDRKNRRLFWEWFRPFISHPNYLRIDNRPVLSFWNQRDLKMIATIVHELNNCSSTEMGFSLFIMRTLSPSDTEKGAYNENNPESSRIIIKELNHIYDGVWEAHPYALRDYGHRRMNFSRIPRLANYHFRGLASSWDYRPRDPQNKKRLSYDKTSNTLYAFARHLNQVLQAQSKHKNVTSNYIVINAWNEWSEGMIMEPSKQNKRHFLQVLQRYRTPNYRGRLCTLLPITSEDNLQTIEKHLGSWQSIHSESNLAEWQVLIFSVSPTPQIPLTLLELIRRLDDARRIRFIDMPLSLQQNGTFLDMLDYLVGKCSEIDLFDWITLTDLTRLPLVTNIRLLDDLDYFGSDVSVLRPVRGHPFSIRAARIDWIELSRNHLEELLI